VFAAQHQQEPIPREGNLMHPSWFKTYDEPPKGGIVVQSWDTAVKTGVRNDWSVEITAIYYQKRYYVLDVFRERVTFGDLRRKLNELCRKYQVERLLIEDASSGQELIQLLHEDLPDGVPRPIAITPLRDKLARFEAQASRVEAGDVVLPQAAPWKADFVAEVAARPGGRHDDQSDALAQMMANPPPTLASTSLAGPELYDEVNGWSGGESDQYDNPWNKPSNGTDDPWAPDLGTTSDPKALNHFGCLLTL
jgi:predicted phage terminase large subunit-like protein